MQPSSQNQNDGFSFLSRDWLSGKKILYLDELYEGTLQNYLRVFSRITKNTAIIGHYPGVKDSGNWLCGKNFQDFPAAGMMHLRISSDQIVNISAGEGKLLRFEYPEMFET